MLGKITIKGYTFNVYLRNRLNNCIFCQYHIYEIFENLMLCGTQDHTISPQRKYIEIGFDFLLFPHCLCRLYP